MKLLTYKNEIGRIGITLSIALISCLVMPQIVTGQMTYYPSGIAVNPNNNMVYVTNELNNSVSVIDGNTNKILPVNITVGGAPGGIAVNPNNDTVYVTNSLSDSVSVIDGKTNQVLPNISVGKAPAGVAVNPSNDMVYVTNFGSDSVSVIDGKTNEVLPVNITIRK